MFLIIFSSALLFCSQASKSDLSNTKIVYVVHKQHNSFIYIMDVDGSGQKRLTKTKNQDSNPSMSPDGTKIVYDLLKGEGSEMYVINKDGSNPVCLGEGSNPAWSPFKKKQ